MAKYNDYTLIFIDNKPYRYIAFHELSNTVSYFYHIL